jgi:hypothetical protein
MATFRTTDGTKWGAGKGLNLSASEVDNNFWEVIERVVDLETNGGAGNGISNITVSGSQMTIFLASGAELGPYTLPRAIIQYRGDWATGASYNELDIISAPADGGIYLVTKAHTAAATFDRELLDGGTKVYQWLFPTQATTINRLDDVDTATTAPVDGDTLVWNAANSLWVPGAPAGGGGAIATLGDVEDVYLNDPPTDGAVLVYSFDGWYEEFPKTTIESMDDYGGSPSEGDVLTWDDIQTRWEARKVPPLTWTIVTNAGTSFSFNFNSAGYFYNHTNVNGSAVWGIPLDTGTNDIPIGGVIRGCRNGTQLVRIFANVGVLLNGVDGAYGDLLNTNEEYTIVKIAANSYRWSKTSSPVT